jgi:3-hydroxymyristoyl/3-hydroxydecanoyl-(acyl carrier protein) dehydratase
MGGRFSAFSFVDRITEVVPGVRARGSYRVPAALREFPSALAAEAVGQLAAWASMAQLEFRRRPVAGLARETRFLRPIRPGDVLTLEADLESCTDDDVAYAGRASVDGDAVIVLDQCLGPMLPAEDFDDPEALRRDYALLCGAGAPSGRFAGLPALELEPGEAVPGERASATLRVPASALFFEDHFPRRPVFPATLLLDRQIRLALGPAREALKPEAGDDVSAARVLDVKVRTFIAPGQVLELAAQHVEADDKVWTARLSARANGKPVATAKVEIAKGSRA